MLHLKYKHTEKVESTSRRGVSIFSKFSAGFNAVQSKCQEEFVKNRMVILNLMCECIGLSLELPDITTDHKVAVTETV